MQRKVIISCAVTGSADTPGKNPAVPVTPQQIAQSAIDAAKAGAAIVHIHVRDPQTTRPSMDKALYREVVERIRASGVDVLINLTTGPGARFTPGTDDPLKPGPATNLKLPAERVEHILELRPDICSLDMGSMNMGGYVFINTPSYLEAMAVAIRDIDVLPELEVFETGHLLLAKRMIETGHIKKPGMFQICLGISWGQPATPEAMHYMRSPVAGGFAVVRVRDIALPVSHGGPGGAARRPRPGRARGQHLSRQGPARPEQCGAGRKSRENHRDSRRPRRDAQGRASDSRVRRGVAAETGVGHAKRQALRYPTRRGQLRLKRRVLPRAMSERSAIVIQVTSAIRANTARSPMSRMLCTAKLFFGGIAK